MTLKDVLGDGQGQGGGRGSPGGLQHPEHDQAGDARGKPAEQTGDDKQADAGQQEWPPAVPVGQGAVKQERHTIADKKNRPGSD